MTDIERSKSTSLQDVYSVFNNWMEIEDTKRIDVMLATALSNKAQELEPLWLIIIGPSGDGKTEMLRSLRDPVELNNQEEAETKRISEITENTLVSGLNEEGTDLAPKLEGKIMLIYDFATILNLPSEGKRKVWAQLRELYDGHIGKQAGSGKDVEYSLDPAPTLLACSTPDIDNQIIQQAKLGTRELLYRIEEKDAEKVDEVLDQVLENHDRMTEMRNELNSTVRSFLNERKPDVDREIGEDVREELKAQAKRLAIMRAQGDFNRSNELIKDVSVEVPTRLVNQLKTLYICLMSLEDDYSPDRALHVIDKVVESSGEPRRERIFQALQDYTDPTAYQIAKQMRVSRSIVQRDLQVLWNVGVVDRKRQETDNDVSYLWEVNESHDLTNLLDNQPLRYRVEQVMREYDDGDGVYPDTITEQVPGSEQEIKDLLENMMDRGDIYTGKVGRYKLT